MSQESDSCMVVNKRGHIHIVEFTENALIDQGEIQAVGAQLEALVEKSGHPHFVIDFSSLQHVSSAMLGVLVSLNKQIKGMKGNLHLANIPPSIMEIFTMTRLDKIFKIFKTVDHAMEKMR